MAKLLYITNGITGSGGLERVLSVKVSLLAERCGHEVHIAALNEPPEKPPFFSFSDKIVRHNLEITGNFFQYLFAYRSGMRNIVKDISPDIISVCDDGLKGFFIPKILQAKIPLIYERHAAASLNGGPIPHILMRRLARDFRRFIVLTEGNRNDWHGGNLAVIPNPLPFFPEKTATLQNKKIMAVGSHSRNKGTGELLQIWEKISEKFPDWHLEIYGKSTPGRLYEKQSEAMGLKNIRFLAPAKDLETAYAATSVLVLPSRSEGFGMAIIEAMACGLPVVSFDCPHGPADIISNRENGFLADNGNVPQFAEKLSLLMENESLRKEMGKKARIASAKYLPENIVNQWDALIKSLLADP